MPEHSFSHFEVHAVTQGLPSGLNAHSFSSGEQGDALRPARPWIIFNALPQGLMIALLASQAGFSNPTAV